MSALQTVAFGAASDGSQGDSVRTGFTKQNSNVAVLQAQAALVSNASTITTAQALTVAHVGKRVNINLATAGTINVPSAATCAADNVLLLRNVGTTVVTLAITTGSGDTCALSKLQAGETAMLDTDGVHAWTVLMRGRTNADNEVVSGNCAVSGNETVGGTLGVTGDTSVGGKITATGGVVGAAGGTSAASGTVGEPRSASQASGSISSAVITAVTSISLTPGEWDITANCRFIPTGTQTPSEFVAGISTINNTFGDFSSYSSSYATNGAGAGASMPSPVVTANVTVNTTIYLVVRCTFGGGGVLSVQGAIKARRVR